MDLSEVSRLYEAIEAETRRAFIGQDDVLDSVLVAIFARGHVLLEGVPGVGKTLLVRVLGKVLGCHFRRVQFTPDLMPSDVTGSTLYNAQKGAFEFKHGPVFTHIMLADEVNRAPAKTQSAMLEAMAERSVTVDGTTHPLPSPFFVLATQNPLESAGTYALPEAQLDRFLFKVLIDHPTVEVEEQLLRNVRDGFDAADLEAMELQQVTSPELVLEMQRSIAQVQVDDKIISYIASLVSNTRRHRAVQIGASPRAAIALLQTARVQAAVDGRAFVVPDDVKTHGRAVLRHRVILQPDAEIEGVTTDEVVEAVLHETQVPGMGEASDRKKSSFRSGGGGGLLGGGRAPLGGGAKSTESGVRTDPVRERGTIPAPSQSQAPASLASPAYDDPSQTGGPRPSAFGGSRGRPTAFSGSP
ncbi:MoxR family ATPase, partial [Myxococcota bacterium]|nr:MoxR family ATPase [Myxococcota bacterium]